MEILLGIESNLLVYMCYFSKFCDLFEEYSFLVFFLSFYKFFVVFFYVLIGWLIVLFLFNDVWLKSFLFSVCKFCDYFSSFI